MVEAKLLELIRTLHNLDDDDLVDHWLILEYSWESLHRPKIHGVTNRQVSGYCRNAVRIIPVWCPDVSGITVRIRRNTHPTTYQLLTIYLYYEISIDKNNQRVNL
ncbi:hypothetical protein [Desulfosporosinus sp. FKA]|uniref:hypothetical protein n=1 Tax=Desulfosporosinus sp. FKA TaxID=1969834 RepID=UPI00112500CD|nr:hypothetical protein [Desulfosporosinus sp. FKA]